MTCNHKFELIETYDVGMCATDVQKLKEKCIECGEERYGTYYDGRKIN